MDQKHNIAVEELLGFFEYEHLPMHLQWISARCGQLAQAMVDGIDDNRELTVGLRKLLEAKDCFVRATVLQTKQRSGA